MLRTGEVRPDDTPFGFAGWIARGAAVSGADSVSDNENSSPWPSETSTPSNKFSSASSSKSAPNDSLFR